MQQVREIIKDRLRAMHSLAEPAEKFLHDDLLIEARDELDAADHPYRKQRERRNPWPRATPRIRPTPSSGEPLKQHDAWKQKREDDRPLDEHGSGEQGEHFPSLARLPRLAGANFLPDQKSQQKDHQRERHIRAHQSRKPYTQQ